MYDNYYNQKIYEFLQSNWSAVQDCLSQLKGIAIDIEHLFWAVCFFGLLFVAFKFIRARWLTLC